MHLLTCIRTPRECTYTQCVSILPLALRHRDIATYMTEALIPSIYSKTWDKRQERYIYLLNIEEKYQVLGAVEGASGMLSC
jgi:hypothetical protein